MLIEVVTKGALVLMEAPLVERVQSLECLVGLDLNSEHLAKILTGQTKDHA